MLVQVKKNNLLLGSHLPLELIPLQSKSSPSSLVVAEQKTFGNIIVSLKSLGNTNYRIEWYSKMTGATTSIAKVGSTDYSVFRKWAIAKRLPDVSHSFDRRKTALVHFLNNVDIIRSTDSVMNEAKNYCLSIFSMQENVHIPPNHKFTRYRLQGAIGNKVHIRARLKSDKIVAEGILLQLIGTQAEVLITNAMDLVNRKKVQKFNSNLVFL